MKLSKEDSLFLYGLLFLVSRQQDFDSESESKISSLLSSLSEFLTEDQVDDPNECQHSGCESGVDDDEDDEDEGSTVEVDKPDPAGSVAPIALGSLPRIHALSPSNDKVTIEFEDVDEEEHVDVLIDEGSVILNAVSHVEVDASLKSIRFFDGEEWHVFLLKKYPKTWSKVLIPGIQYSVSSGDTEEDDDE